MILLVMMMMVMMVTVMMVMMATVMMVVENISSMLSIMMTKI